MIKDDCTKRLDQHIVQLAVQLAGCLAAAEGHILNPVKKGDYGWSPAYQAVLDLRREYEALLEHMAEES